MKNHTKKALKVSNGITLIALVITIIVLLILAGVAIAMLTGENSILKRATESKELNDKSQIVEQARLDIMAKLAEKRGTNPTKAEIQEILGTYFNGVPSDLSDQTQEMTTKSGGYTVKLSEVLNGVTVGATSSAPSDPLEPETPPATSVRASITPAPTGSTYTIGQEVTFGDEQFFVLSDNGTTVELLAKYCLNQAGTAQINGTHDKFERPFSTINYWSSDFTNTPYDLNQTTPPNSATAINTAISYGAAKGATGKLITYAEANTIANGTDATMKNILFARYAGESAVPKDDWGFWTATANTSESIYVVRFIDEGSGACEISDAMINPDYVGVRPILEVQ